MRFFTCLLDPDDRGIPEATLRAYETLPRARGLAFQWHFGRCAAVLTGEDQPHSDSLIAQHGDLIGVGMARLDNRAALRDWAGGQPERLTDLELILRVIARHGARYISQFLGDFAFVVWDGNSRAGAAATDAFAVRKLYYTQRGGLTAFASRAEALALEERYEVRYLVELLTQQAAPLDITVYSGVRPLQAAAMALFQEGKLNVRQYWSAVDQEPASASSRSEQSAVEECRQLLAESIRLRLAPDGRTWAQLSGGLDSSSIVSLAQWLAERGEITCGLGGTVTFVGVQGTGTDEREYSDAVVSRWRVRNEKDSYSLWHDERYAPPYIDQPSFEFQCYPRDARMCEVIRNAGGEVLLTGWGGDEIFMSNMLFFADWVARGRIWSAVREMAHRAAIGRVSFWELAYKNALLPLLPRALQQRLVHDELPIQSWLDRATLRRYGIALGRSAMAPEFGGRVGQKYRHSVVARIGVLAKLPAAGLVDDSLDVRYPMLYRPLVEFTLRLSPELRGRPHAHRWVLREAMRGILPEVVRTRVGKGGTGEVLALTLARHRARLSTLLEEPILAELGVLDAKELRAAFDATEHQTGVKEYLHGVILSTLSVEAWLQMRSGRWPRGGHLTSAEAVSN